jgi:hypothetical protein
MRARRMFSAFLFGVVVNDCLERLFWLPRHVRIGHAVPRAGIAFHQAVAGHVEVVLGIIIIRGNRRDKSHYKSPINTCSVEHAARASAMQVRVCSFWIRVPSVKSCRGSSLSALMERARLGVGMWRRGLKGETGGNTRLTCE